jgi:hypothetical protein
MENIVKIREILQELGYMVTLKQTEKGLTAVFPNKKLFSNSPITAIKRYYSPMYGDTPGIDFYSTNLEPHNKFVDCPEYVVRLAIACDIISVCTYYEYNPKLILVYDKEDKLMDYNSTLTLSELVKETQSERQQELELKLKGIVQKAIPGHFGAKYAEQAKKHNVVEGYEFLRKILRGEQK